MILILFTIITKTNLYAIRVDITLCHTEGQTNEIYRLGCTGQYWAFFFHTDKVTISNGKPLG